MGPCARRVSILHFHEECKPWREQTFGEFYPICSLSRLSHHYVCASNTQICFEWITARMWCKSQEHTQGNTVWSETGILKYSPDSITWHIKGSYVSANTTQQQRTSSFIYLAFCSRAGWAGSPNKNICGQVVKQVVLSDAQAAASKE